MICFIFQIFFRKWGIGFGGWIKLVYICGNCSFMSTVNALFHIVISTKYRKMTLTSVYRKDLYRYMWSLIEEMHCKLLRIGGIENHVHILVDLSSSVSLACKATETAK